ncbi:hypothetical protein B0O80DRAFT_232206 [Mortierella sp. GBAus27b]|nr:hypothetical protein B0O80DRAFT_232206 [Mortierella sp. GBAus27b]
MTWCVYTAYVVGEALVGFPVSGVTSLRVRAAGREASVLTTPVAQHLIPLSSIFIVTVFAILLFLWRHSGSCQS